MITKLGGRKFLIAILGLIIMTVIIFTIPELRESAMEQIKYIISAYVISNALKAGMEEINKKS